MIKTSTPELDFTVNQTEKAAQTLLSISDQPSARVIQNILNFSRTLEVKPSILLGSIDYLRT